jgi:hypothetical protein
LRGLTFLCCVVFQRSDILASALKVRFLYTSWTLKTRPVSTYEYKITQKKNKNERRRRRPESRYIRKPFSVCSRCAHYRPIITVSTRIHHFVRKRLKSQQQQQQQPKSS